MILVTLAGLLVIAWLILVFAVHVAGGLVHLLLILAAILVIRHLVRKHQGR